MKDGLQLLRICNFAGRSLHQFGKLQPVTNTVNRLNPTGRVRVLLNLRSKADDMLVDRPCCWKRSVTPDAVQKPVAGDGFTCSRSEQMQHSKFFHGQVNCLSAAP